MNFKEYFGSPDTGHIGARSMDIFVKEKLGLLSSEKIVDHISVIDTSYNTLCPEEERGIGVYIYWPDDKWFPLLKENAKKLKDLLLLHYTREFNQRTKIILEIVYQGKGEKF